jgi:hypothetical protein
MKNGIKIKNGSGIMKYNVKLSKGKININGKDYDIPREVAEFIIYETSTRDDIIQTRDVYKRTIEKAIKYLDCWRDNWYNNTMEDDKEYICMLSDILKKAVR